MKKLSGYINGSLITIVLLCLSFGISLLFQYIFEVQEHITTVFVFAVFLISLLTKGYVYGILAAFVGTIAVNYAFTFPYFALNFTIPVNFISGIIMIIISILTSALTTKLKQHEVTKAESERERMRANLLRAVSHDLRTPLTTIYASIIKAIWGGIAHEGSIKKLQVNMANIRRKLGSQPGEVNYIINELGVGYRMNAEHD